MSMINRPVPGFLAALRVPHVTDLKWAKEVQAQFVHEVLTKPAQSLTRALRSVPRKLTQKDIEFFTCKPKHCCAENVVVPRKYVLPGIGQSLSGAHNAARGQNAGGDSLPTAPPGEAGDGYAISALTTKTSDKKTEFLAAEDRTSSQETPCHQPVGSLKLSINLPISSTRTDLAADLTSVSYDDDGVSSEYNFRDWVPTHPKDPILSVWSQEYVDRYGWEVENQSMYADWPTTNTPCAPPPARPRDPIIRPAAPVPPARDPREPPEDEVLPEYDFRDWVPTSTHPKDPRFSIWSQEYVDRYGWQVDDHSLDADAILPSTSPNHLPHPATPTAAPAHSPQPSTGSRDADSEVLPEYDFRDWAPSPTHPKDPIFSIWSRDYVNRYGLDVDDPAMYADPPSEPVIPKMVNLACPKPLPSEPSSAVVGLPPMVPKPPTAGTKPPRVRRRRYRPVC